MRIYNVQWIAATHGEQHFCTQIVHVGSGCLAVIQRWPLFSASASGGRYATQTQLLLVYRPRPLLI